MLPSTRQSPSDFIKYLYPKATTAIASSLVNAIIQGKIEAYSLAMSIGLAHIVSDVPSSDGLISIAQLFETGYTPTNSELKTLFSEGNKPVIEQHHGSDDALVSRDIRQQRQLQTLGIRFKTGHYQHGRGTAVFLQ